MNEAFEGGEGFDADVVLHSFRVGAGGRSLTPIAKRNSTTSSWRSWTSSATLAGITLDVVLMYATAFLIQV